MFHPYSFYLQKHKIAKIKRESALPFFSFPLLLHLVIHTPDAPNRLLLCPISSFGVSHFAIWGIPFHHLGYPISPFGISHFAIWGVPFHHLGYPISPFGVSHFAFWDVPFYHLGYPISPFGMSHFAIWGIPFHLLGCPILPFGMSHFAFWGIPFYHLGCPILPFGVYFRHICAQCTAPIFGLPSSFSLQNMCVFFVNLKN